MSKNATWNFAAELQRLGPDAWNYCPDLASARSYCARVTRSHYENFTVVSALLPRPLIPHFQAVYAYCRWSDDLADETEQGERALQLLGWWREQLQECYTAKRPTHPVMIALQVTIHQFGIPAQPFLDLIDAFEQDQRQKSYETFDDLVDYCRRSADPVGRLVLHLFRCFDPDRASLSDQVCTGLQLANFWQDVSRDLVIGRVYLPREDLKRYGVSDADLQNRRFTPAFRDLLKFEVERTRGFFQRGKALLPLLPMRARVDVELFIRGGEAILNAIESQDFDVFVRRPEVSKSMKLRLLVKALLASWIGVG